ncbi:MAG: HAD-IA family hydrolase [Planctomycetes bacterium]|nr:HAD-IA family hydrolase [Planctomycetota bacterium]
MPLRAMLLDLDGTLVDSLADITASVDHVRAAYGLAPLGTARVRAMVGDGAARLLARALADRDPVPPLAELWPRYEAHHEAQCTRLVRPYPGVVDALRRWRQAGVRTAVVTNKPERFATRILEHLNLHVDTVVGGDTLPERKPSPAPLLEALRRLGVAPGDAAMLGDGVQDLRAGKAAGVRTIAALWGFRSEAELRAEGADEYRQTPLGPAP